MFAQETQEKPNNYFTLANTKVTGHWPVTMKCARFHDRPANADHLLDRPVKRLKLAAEIQLLNKTQETKWKCTADGLHKTQFVSWLSIGFKVIWLKFCNITGVWVEVWIIKSGLRLPACRVQLWRSSATSSCVPPRLPSLPQSLRGSGELWRS